MLIRITSKLNVVNANHNLRININIKNYFNAWQRCSEFNDSRIESCMQEFVMKNTNRRRVKGNNDWACRERTQTNRTLNGNRKQVSLPH